MAEIEPVIRAVHDDSQRVVRFVHVRAGHRMRIADLQMMTGNRIASRVQQNFCIDRVHFRFR